jgi:hypothetical protein
MLPRLRRRVSRLKSEFKGFVDFEESRADAGERGEPEVERDRAFRLLRTDGTFFAFTFFPYRVVL